MHTNDCIQNVLMAVPHSIPQGHIQEMLLTYFQSQGATANNYKDAEMEFLIANGSTLGTSVQDMWLEFYISKGYLVGTLQDRANAYWCDQVVVTWDNVLTVGNLGTDYGFSVFTGPFGALVPNTMLGATVQFFYTQDTIDEDVFCNFSFAQIPTVNTIRMVFEGFGTRDLLWTGANLDYRIIDAGLSAWIISKNGQDINIRVSSV